MTQDSCLTIRLGGSECAVLDFVTFTKHLDLNPAKTDQGGALSVTFKNFTWNKYK